MTYDEDKGFNIKGTTKFLAISELPDDLLPQAYHLVQRAFPYHETLVMQEMKAAPVDRVAIMCKEWAPIPSAGFLSVERLPKQYTPHTRYIILNNVPSRGYQPAGGLEDKEHLLLSAAVYQSAYEATNARLTATLDQMERQLKELDTLCMLFNDYHNTRKDSLSNQKSALQQLQELKRDRRDSASCWYDS